MSLFLNKSVLEPKKGWNVVGVRNIALIQNPGWNKTTVNTLCRDAVLQIGREDGRNYLVDDMTEKAVFERMKKTGRCIALYPELEVFMDTMGSNNKVT